MNCRSAENLFSAFIEEELSEEERRSLESHLMGCRRCAVSVKELRASLDLVASLPRVEASAHFDEDVMDRIRSGEALRPTLIEWLGEALRPARLRPLFLAGATVCAVWISVLLVQPHGIGPNPRIARNTEIPPSVNQTPAVASSDAGKDAATPPAPAPANAAPEAARSALASASRTGAPGPAPGAASRMASAPAGYAWADHDVPMNESAVDSTKPGAATPYQDEYILDQFYLNRSDQDGVHSIVPVSGQNTDDVYITF